MNTARTMVMIFTTSCALIGCKSNDAMPDDPRFAPVPPQAMIAPENTNGSLYREGYGLSLFEDTTARRVGDILTINLVENFESESSSDHTLQRETELKATSPTLLGGQPRFRTPGILSGPGSLSLDVEHELESKGSNSSTQSGKLSTGTITVNVVEILPNGNLKVRGEKWLTLNNDKQYVRLSGIVRPDDIMQDNSVESTKIANARIEYNGTGSVSETNVPGWISRFILTKFWPF